MPKSVLKILLMSILIAPAAFADTTADIDNDDTLSPFNKQGDSLKHPKPNSEESFFATRAPMEVTLRRYIGVNIGANFATLKPTITANSARNLDTQALSPNTPKLSWGANIYGGLGTNYDHFYIGAELSGGYNTLKYNQTTTIFKNNNNTTISFKQPLNLGLDLMPGYITSQKDFLIYGRIGLATSMFNIRINNERDSAINKFLFGWRAGLGAEYFMSDSFSTRFEYIFTNYNNINQTYISNSSTNLVNPTTYTYKLTSPHTQQINIGLTVNF